MPQTRGRISDAEKRKRAQFVVVMWIDDYGPENYVSTLQYKGPDIPSNAATRVYRKDKYDGRCGNDLPYFDYAEDALEFMRENREKMCQVSLNAAHKIWPSERFMFDGEVLV